MCHSKNEKEYDTLYCHFISQAPHQIIDYFNKKMCYALIAAFESRYIGYNLGS